MASAYSRDNPSITWLSSFYLKKSHTDYEFPHSKYDDGSS